MPFHTYSFDRGDGKRRRGYTARLPQREREHRRTFPNMRDFRTWEHPTKSDALAHERHLHTLPTQMDARKRKEKTMPLPALPGLAGFALSTVAPYIVPRVIDKALAIDPGPVRKRIGKQVRRVRRSLYVARKEWREPIIGE